MKLSPVIYKTYTIKQIAIGSRTTWDSAQDGFAFVICRDTHAVFGLGLKVFTFVQEDITEDIKNTLLRLGKEKAISMIDKNEFEKGKYYCYKWIPNNPVTNLSEVKNEDEWGTVIPSLLDMANECTG